MKKQIIGAMTALVTPFKNGKLDVNSYEKLIKMQIQNNIDAVVPVGSTGECATLSLQEHKECIDIAIQTCKNTKTKVLAGAGSSATHKTIDLAKYAQTNGADGILSVTPYYNKPMQEGLYLHYKALANSVEIPVLLYNVPSRTGCDLLPCTIKRLYDDCENIYGVKEATGLLERCVDLLASHPDMAVISGEDAINYPILANGGKGVISVTSNILPKQIADLTTFAMSGDFDKAKKINDELFNINKILFCESNPIPIKAALYLAGIIECLEYRLPLSPPNKENMQKIEKTLQQYDIKGLS